ncbi:hypothetical protein V5O48_011644, partial [Marasmius crinis-equi]
SHVRRWRFLAHDSYIATYRPNTPHAPSSTLSSSKVLYTSARLAADGIYSQLAPYFRRSEWRTGAHLTCVSIPYYSRVRYEGKGFGQKFGVLVSGPAEIGNSSVGRKNAGATETSGEEIPSTKQYSPGPSKLISASFPPILDAPSWDVLPTILLQSASLALSARFALSGLTRALDSCLERSPIR